MIRTDVILWVSVLLVILFAFVLLPIHERFTDAKGRQTDVSPDAPAKPEWLKPISESGGKKEGFWNFPTWKRESMTNGTPTRADVENLTESFLSTLIANETDPMIKANLQQTLTDSINNFANVSPDNKALPPNSSQMDTYTALQSIQGNPDYSTFSKVIQTMPPLTPTPNNVPVLISYLTKAIVHPAVGPAPVGGVALAPVPMQPPPPSHLHLLPSPTAPAPRITSTLGVAPPSLSGMHATYTSGIIAPQGTPWAAAVAPPDLYGPGPTVQRGALQGCSCASQAGSCPVHA